MAIRKLLDTTNHIQARAAQLEASLGALREQERGKAVKELLLALRNSPDGDLLRSDPALPGDSCSRIAQAIIGALREAFAILPIRAPGERIAIRHAHIPDTLDLDRSLGNDLEQCLAVEVVSGGWSYGNQVLLKPVVRPVFATPPPAQPAQPAAPPPGACPSPAIGDPGKPGAGGIIANKDAP